MRKESKMQRKTKNINFDYNQINDICYQYSVVFGRQRNMFSRITKLFYSIIILISNIKNGKVDKPVEKENTTMLPEVFETLVLEMPSEFSVKAKQDGYYLGAVINGMYYYINLITQETGNVYEEYKGYLFSGYRISGGFPVVNGKRIITRKRNINPELTINGVKQ